MSLERVAEYRNPYSGLCQARAIEIEAALHDIACELGVRLDNVQRATLAAVLERFAERWPKERRW